MRKDSSEVSGRRPARLTTVHALGVWDWYFLGERRTEYEDMNLRPRIKRRVRRAKTPAKSAA